MIECEEFNSGDHIPEWERTYKYILDNGKMIGEDHRNGNEKALKVIRYYSMVHSCPGDNMAKVLLCEATKEYIEHKERGKKG